MTQDPSIQSRVLDLLLEIDFDVRYYGFVRSFAPHGPESTTTPKRDKLKQVLAATSLAFHFQSKDKSFIHATSQEGVELALLVSFSSSSVEMSMVLSTGTQVAGGPYARLARFVGQLRDPAFAPVPASPKLPYSNLEQLQAAVDFGVQLFRDSRQAFVGAGLLAEG